MSIDVEREFNVITKALGGQRVSEIVGVAPPFDNADYLFPDARVIAELKCLDDDKMLDEGMIAKVSELYVAEMRAKRAPGIVFGTVTLTTQGFSDTYWRDVKDLYKAPLQRLVKKANEQIKSTRTHLQRNDHRGLLIVANNNHSALDPWHGWFAFNEILRQPLYRGINAALYFAANMPVIDPASGKEVSFWTEIRRPHLPSVDTGLLTALRIQWLRRLTELKGETQFWETTIGPEHLGVLSNKK